MLPQFVRTARWSFCYTSQPIANYVNNLHCLLPLPYSYSSLVYGYFGMLGLKALWLWCVPSSCDGHRIMGIFLTSTWWTYPALSQEESRGQKRRGGTRRQIVWKCKCADTWTVAVFCPGIGGKYFFDWIYRTHGKSRMLGHGGRNFLIYYWIGRRSVCAANWIELGSNNIKLIIFQWLFV